MPNCELCGEPMPPGEEMFKYHGYSGPCPKATSPGYWALIRQHFPKEFARADALSRKLGKKLVRLNDEREFLDKLPADQETTAPIVPDCDFLCAIAEMDLEK